MLITETEPTNEMTNEDGRVKEEVEKIGIVCDKDGFPPLAGRLLGYLMLAEPPHKTFDEIVDFLQASKSAVSNTLKFMEAQGMVDYITFPGDRKRYFKMNASEWHLVVLKKMEFIKQMREKIAEVIEIRTDAHPDFNQELKDLHELYNLFLEELPKLVMRWKANRNK